MWLKIKLWLYGMAAAAITMFYVLFKNERRKRVKAETEVELYQKKNKITNVMNEARNKEEIREAQEIERKTNEARKVSVFELDDYIDSL